MIKTSLSHLFDDFVGGMNPRTSYKIELYCGNIIECDDQELDLYDRNYLHSYDSDDQRIEILGRNDNTEYLGDGNYHYFIRKRM